MFASPLLAEGVGPAASSEVVRPLGQHAVRGCLAHAHRGGPSARKMRLLGIPSTTQNAREKTSPIFPRIAAALFLHCAARP
jgi:hypothetical protein